MPKFSTVLAVSDLSEISNRAVPYAYALVDDGGTVHLVHVLQYDPSPSPLVPRPSNELNLPERRAKAIAQAVERLKGQVPPEAQDRNITTKIDAVLHPDVAKGIVTEGEKRKVDAIVMGSQGRSGWERLVTGSFCQKVTQASEIPVLVVPRVDY